MKEEPVDAGEEEAFPDIVQNAKVEFEDKENSDHVEVTVDITIVKEEMEYDEEDTKVKEEEPRSTVKKETWADENVVIVKQEMEYDEEDSKVKEEEPRSTEKDEPCADDNITTISMQHNEKKGLESADLSAFTCDYCKRLFKKRSSLFTHICRKHSTMTHKCNECNKIFKCVPYLLHHIATVHSGVEYDCRVCGKIFHTEKSMRKHIRRVHSKANLECSTCQKKFKVKDHLARHIAGKHGTERHQCEICKKVYRATHLLKIHMKGIHEKQQATSASLRKCNVCMKQFKCIIYLQRHKQRGNCHMKKILQCDACNIVFRNNGTLKRHVMRVHSSIRYECDICHKQFKMKDHLNHHLASMHGNEKHECKFCGKIFRAKQSMQKHVRCVHILANREQYKCPICYKDFKFISYLRRHQTRSKCTKPKMTMKMRQSKDIIVKEEPESIQIELNPEIFQNMDYNYVQIKEEPLYE